MTRALPWFLTLLLFPALATAATNVRGTISADTTWTLTGSPYVVTSTVTVNDSSGPATLTIEPGVEVRFNRYQYLSIGASSGNGGALAAQGTAAAPIIFTANQAAPVAGDWYGIWFNNTTVDAATVLDHCRVKYAGYYSRGALHMEQASPAIRNTVIDGSSLYGISVSASAPTLENVAFTNVANYGLYYSGAVGGSVSNCAIANGIYLLATGSVAFSNNTVSYNNSYPIKAYPDMVGAIVNGCAFTNVNAASFIEVNSGTMIRDATWSAAVPYRIISGLTVQGTDGGDGVTTLTIAPGAVLKFNAGTQLTVGGSSGNPGALRAQGTAAAPILFTSNQPTPAAGDWGGIKFYDTSRDDAGLIEYCAIQYAGYGLYLQDAKPALSNSTYRYNSQAAIYVGGAGANGALITCNTFQANLYAIYAAGGALPVVSQNNFMGQTNQALYNGNGTLLNAENNWWADPQGPNRNGEKTYGNVDADPWSPAENACGGSVGNYPPFAPGNPTPADNAVRVAADGAVALSWSALDPNAADTLSFDLYRGSSAASLQLEAQGLTQPNYSLGGLARGVTCFWRVIARDSGGLATSGPVWRFTSTGDPPDLIISSISTTPSGMPPNRSVTLQAQVTNIGSGPVVDGFSTRFAVNGAAIGTVATSGVILAGQSVTVNQGWYYPGGDPTLAITADSQNTVAETNENNNQRTALLSSVADITAPVVMASQPANNARVRQLTQITVTLADSQSTLNDTAVKTSITLRNAAQQTLAVSVTENNDTFSVVPGTLPLADGAYLLSGNAVDSFGNTRAFTVTFTIDTVPPAKPTITGGTVASGLILPRPVQNSHDRVMATLTGTRENGTTLWVNGAQLVGLGNGAWSCQIALNPGANTLEVYCLDEAGNHGPSEWVDISLTAQSTVRYEYDSQGRLKKTRSNQ